MRLIGFGFLALAIAFTACTKKPAKTPTEVVRNFVELSASAKDPADRKKLKELCAGKLEYAFERMTDEAFRILYLGNQIKITDLAVLSAEEKGTRASVAYRITVNNQGGTDPTVETNEREVELVKDGGYWKIDTIEMKGTDRVAFTQGMIF